jgi:hypothetical protein
MVAPGARIWWGIARPFGVGGWLGSRTRLGLPGGRAPIDSPSRKNVSVPGVLASISVQSNRTNLLDEDIQQHVFGDIIGRKIMGEVRLTY